MSYPRGFRCGIGLALNRRDESDDVSKSTKIKIHHQIFSDDLPVIADYFVGDPSGFTECRQLLDEALMRIRSFPAREGIPCEFEPLSSAGLRKVKVFSVRRPARGDTPTLRILYRYNEQKDNVEILAIGFRIKVRPRPADDPYSVASRRL